MPLWGIYITGVEEIKEKKEEKNERDGREDGKRISEKVKQVESYHRLVLTQSSWREV